MGFECSACGKVMATEGGLEIHLARTHVEPEEVERPPLPNALVVANRAGYALVAFGLLMSLFSAYQLWGTDLVAAYHQRSLKAEAAGPPPAPGVPPLPAPTGESVAVIRIPKLGLEKAVVAGVGVADLKKGPGHYPGTPLPGQPGNTAIAGHRTTYGAPFSRLDELVEGDEILVSTAQGSFRYRVSNSLVVHPGQSEVLAPTHDSRMTLTTCHPRYSAAQRLIVVASLETPAANLGGDRPAPPSGGAAPEAGLSGADADPRPAIAYGMASLVALVAARAWRRRLGTRMAWVFASPALAVVLFLFFENFDRLLPGNI